MKNMFRILVRRILRTGSMKGHKNSIHSQIYLLAAALLGMFFLFQNCGSSFQARQAISGSIASSSRDIVDDQEPPEFQEVPPFEIPVPLKSEIGFDKPYVFLEEDQILRERFYLKSPLETDLTLDYVIYDVRDEKNEFPVLKASVVIPKGEIASEPIDIDTTQFPKSNLIVVSILPSDLLAFDGFSKVDLLVYKNTSESKSLSNFSKISAGDRHSCAVLLDGEVSCWGQNHYGELGDGTFNYSDIPVRVKGLKNVKKVSVGYGYTCALLNDASIWCWGANESGQLGNGTKDMSHAPVRVSGIKAAIDLTLGASTSCAILSDRQLSCWGRKLAGLYSPETSSSPTAIPELTQVKSIALNTHHGCAVKSEGSVWCWGHGDLGDGTLTSSVPVRALGISNAVSVAVGLNHSCAVLEGGAVSCWGDALGTGLSSSSPLPVAVPGITGVQQLDLGHAYSCALLAGGKVSCWGFNGSGALGIGSMTDTRSPVLLEIFADPITELSSAFGTSCAISTRNQLSCWGWRRGGGVYAYVPFPSLVKNLSSASELGLGPNHSCAVSPEDTVFCWGSNSVGELGDGGFGSRSDPSRVVGLAGVKTVTSGYIHSCALLVDGNVYCWGGFGNWSKIEEANRVPIKIEGLNLVRKISAGFQHTCALRSDTTVWCWSNSDLYGAIGPRAGSFPITEPRPVEGLVNVKDIAMGSQHSCALLNDGTVTCWGGEIGRSNRAPKLVMGLSQVKAIAAGSNFNCALLNDATVQCWGKNNVGQLGNGSTTDSSTPVVVNGLSNVSQIAVGYNSACAALKDGSLFCWGASLLENSGYPQVHMSSLPVLVSGIGSVKQIELGDSHACAIQQDGKVFCFGDNGSGQAGRLHKGHALLPSLVWPFL